MSLPRPSRCACHSRADRTMLVIVSAASLLYAVAGPLRRLIQALP